MNNIFLSYLIIMVILVRSKMENRKNDLESLELPSGWSKLSKQPNPPKPKSIWEFLNSVKVSEKDVRRGRPIKKMFTL